MITRGRVREKNVVGEVRQQLMEQYERYEKIAEERSSRRWHMGSYIVYKIVKVCRLFIILEVYL